MSFLGLPLRLVQFSTFDIVGIFLTLFMTFPKHFWHCSEHSQQLFKSQIWSSSSTSFPGLPPRLSQVPLRLSSSALLTLLEYFWHCSQHFRNIFDIVRNILENFSNFKLGHTPFQFQIQSHLPDSKSIHISLISNPVVSLNFKFSHTPFISNYPSLG